MPRLTPSYHHLLHFSQMTATLSRFLTLRSAHSLNYYFSCSRYHLYLPSISLGSFRDCRDLRIGSWMINQSSRRAFHRQLSSHPSLYNDYI